MLTTMIRKTCTRTKTNKQSKGAPVDKDAQDAIVDEAIIKFYMATIGVSREAALQLVEMDKKVIKDNPDAFAMFDGVKVLKD